MDSGRTRSTTLPMAPMGGGSNSRISTPATLLNKQMQPVESIPEAPKGSSLTQTAINAAKLAEKNAEPPKHSAYSAFVSTMEHIKADHSYDISDFPAIYKKQQMFSTIWDGLLIITSLMVSLNIGYKLYMTKHTFRPPHAKVNQFITLTGSITPLLFALFLLFEEKTGIKEQAERLLWNHAYHTDVHIHTFMDKHIINNKHIKIRMKHIFGVASILAGGGLGLFLGKKFFEEREKFIESQKEDKSYTLTEFIYVGEHDYDKFERFAKVHSSGHH